MLKAPMMTWLLAMLLVVMAAVTAELFDKQRITDKRGAMPKPLLTEVAAEGAEHLPRRVREAVALHVESILKPHDHARRRTARGPPRSPAIDERGREDND